MSVKSVFVLLSILAVQSLSTCVCLGMVHCISRSGTSLFGFALGTNDEALILRTSRTEYLQLVMFEMRDLK